MDVKAMNKRIYTMNHKKAIGLVKDCINNGMTLDEALNSLQDMHFLFDDEIEILQDYFKNL